LLAKGQAIHTNRISCGAMDGAPDASFVLYPQLTPVQDRAFQLLALGVKV
jgi:hypothetical protein